MDLQWHGLNPSMGVPYGSDLYQQSQMIELPGSVVTPTGNMQSTHQSTMGVPYGSNPYQQSQITGELGSVVTSAGNMQSTHQSTMGVLYGSNPYQQSQMTGLPRSVVTSAGNIQSNGQPTMGVPYGSNLYQQSQMIEVPRSVVTSAGNMQSNGQPTMGVPNGSNPYQQSQMTGVPGSVVTSAWNMQSTGQRTMGVPFGSNPYEQSQMTGVPGSVVTSAGKMQSTGQPTGAQLGQDQLAYQQIHQQQQQQLQQQLQQFWENQYQMIENVTIFKNQSLPLAKIKKIMKVNAGVPMISAEAIVLFARACELFILELTLRSWNYTEEDRRNTLSKSDIAAAITGIDIFDFLVGIVPCKDLKDEVHASIPRGPMPDAGPADALPYMYMQPQHAPQASAPDVIMRRPMMDLNMYSQQPHPNMAPQMLPRQLDQ